MREIALIILILTSHMSFLGSVATNFSDQLATKLTVKPTAPATMDVSKAAQIAPNPTKTTTEKYASNSQSVYSVDLDSNAVLVSQEPDAKKQIASVTKLMTAYTFMRDSKDQGETVTVPGFNLHFADAVAGLNPGDQLSRVDLLRAMLINSGSDAAQAVATIDAGSIEKFVEKMNQNAAGLNLTNTHFANPVGWDDQNNYSTAKDIAELTRILLRNEDFAKIVSTRFTTIYTKAGRPINLTNTNQLLGSGEYVGVKTGTTDAAGECLVSLRVVGGQKILSVVLGSGNRYFDTQSVNSWISGHFIWNY